MLKKNFFFGTTTTRADMRVYVAAEQPKIISNSEGSLILVTKTYSSLKCTFRQGLVIISIFNRIAECVKFLENCVVFFGDIIEKSKAMLVLFACLG